MSGSGYDVGYGKPPKAGQFKKGHSGNPSGKKKPLDADALIMKEMSKTVSATINNQKQKLTKLEFIITTTAQKAMTGDLSATKLLLESVGRSYLNSPEEGQALSEHHLAMLHDFFSTTQGGDADEN